MRDHGFTIVVLTCRAWPTSAELGPYRLLPDAGAVEFNAKNENMSILTDCDTGALYLVQMEQDDDGVDRIWVRRLLLSGTDEELERVDTAYLGTLVFWCRGDEIDGAETWCNFDAAVGTYVDPYGELILYATEKEQSDEGNVRVTQFR